jgi:hypothetical protein
MTASDDARIGRLAEVGAGVGVVGLVSLGLMFAIEVPNGGPYRFGTINDLSGAAFNALLIPVAIRIARDAPPDSGLRLATGAAVVAGCAGTVLPILLVTGAMPLQVQMPLVVACIEIQSLWLIVLGRALRDVAGRERLGTVSRVVGASFIAGSALFGAGFAAPDGSPLRMAAWALGGIVGVAGYVGWPYWFRAVGRALRKRSTPVDSTAEGLAWTGP